MKRFFANMRFRTKFFLISMFISLIPTMTLGILCYVHLNSLLIEREQITLRDSISQEVSNISSNLHSYETALAYIAWDLEINNALNKEYESNAQSYLAYTDVFEPALNAAQYLSPGDEQITIYTDTKIIPKKGVLEPLRNLEINNWNQGISSPFPLVANDSGGSKTILLFDSFAYIKQDITAHVCLELSPNELFTNLTRLFQDSYGILITDSKGDTVWCYQTEDVAAIMVDTSDCGFPEDRFIMESITDYQTDWTYYIYRPLQYATKPANVVIQTVIFTLISCLVLVVILSYWFSRTLVRPLEMLTAKINQVAKGDYRPMDLPKSRDEVGNLIVSFSEMVVKINTLINDTLKAKIAQQKLEFKALQAQINPHFLYNTLSLINSQSIIAGHPEIGLLARYLSTFYKTSLNKGKEIIQVRDEIENVKAYVNIQLIIHSNSFDVHYDIDQEILNCTMPNLMLQPLVENAIEHGIVPKNSGGRGVLSISAKSDGKDIVFTVLDNGCGIPENVLTSLQTRCLDSYGVENVQTRTRLYYGSQYGLKYRSKLGCGTEVTLIIPKQ